MVNYSGLSLFKNIRPRKIAIGILCVLIVIFSALMIFSSIMLEKTWQQIKFQCESSYDYIVISTDKTNLNSYLYLDSTFMNYSDGIYINSVQLMELPNINYSKSIINEKNIYKGTYKTLPKNHVALSRNISKRYGLTIGDTIDVKGVVSSSAQKYVIDYIIDYNYGFCGIDIDSEKSIVLYGYDEQYENLLTPKYVSFIEGKPSDLFGGNGNSIIDIYKKSTEMRPVSTLFILLIIIILIITMLCGVVIYIFLLHTEFRYIKHLVQMGVDFNFLYKKYSIISFLFSSAIVAVGCLVTLITIAIAFRSFSYVSIITMLFSSCILFTVEYFINRIVIKRSIRNG